MTARRAGVLIAVLLVSVGCATDGRELADPEPGATAPPLPTSTTTPSSGEPGAVIGPDAGSNAPAATIVVSSPAFADGGAIPARHSCAGENVSPPLSWTGVPPGTVELVVLVSDVTVGVDYEWAVAGIDPVVVGLGEDGVPEGAVEVRPWSGPCLAPGEVHEYLFAVHALPAPSGLTAASTAAEVAAVTAGTPVGVLRGFYPTPPG